MAKEDIVPVQWHGRSLTPHKTVMRPIIGERTVLTNSPWTFVALWLKRQHKERALFYWQQAEEFHKVAEGLPPQSAPLLRYYSFLNATKALLDTKGVPIQEGHGVREASGNATSLKSLGIKYRDYGVLPSLSDYYGEAETSNAHSLQELFFNMVFIHRTYCLTYTSQTEMFIPLAECGFVAQRSTKRVYFRAEVTNKMSFASAARRLPSLFAADPAFGSRAIRSEAFVSCHRPSTPTANEISQIADLNRTLRRELQFINGTEALWYIRGRVPGPAPLRRQLPTLILSAMHRLSEICRYKPLQLASLLAGQKNWLLSEFIEMSAPQFIDEIASELTGLQFLVPNIRAAN
jgi:hypothetical protein